MSPIARACVPGEVVGNSFDKWRVDFPCWVLGHKLGTAHQEREVVRALGAEGWIVGESDERPCVRCQCWVGPGGWARNRPLKRPFWTRGIQYDRRWSDIRDHAFGAGPWGTWEIRVQWKPRVRVRARWYGRRRKIWSDELDGWVSPRRWRREHGVV